MLIYLGMQKKFKIALHTLAWLVIFIYSVIPGYQYDIYKREVYHGSFSIFVWVSLIYFSTKIIAFYITAYLIAPQFFKYKRWLLGILYILLFFIFSTVLRYVLEFYVLLPFLDFHNYKGKTPEIWYYIENNVNYVLYNHFLYGFLFYIIAEWYLNGQKQKELEKEKIAAELAFLKSQINPHFLFNTLNDIYALTYRKSSQAPDTVLKLSELLRYMLKESDGTFVALPKEIEYLKNVIDLLQIGQKGGAFINFDIEGVSNDKQIAPLILINFVENAFKHGVIDNPHFPIEIKLDLSNIYLMFMVKNLKNKDQKDHTGGIGLTNVKRRLALIYPNKHTLNIEEKDNSFMVLLKIEWI